MRNRVYLKAVRVLIEGELPPSGAKYTWKMQATFKGKSHWIECISEATRADAYAILPAMYRWHGWDLRKEKIGYSIKHNDDY